MTPDGFQDVNPDKSGSDQIWNKKLSYRLETGRQQRISL